jgi:hypothetical protein
LFKGYFIEKTIVCQFAGSTHQIIVKRVKIPRAYTSAIEKYKYKK